MQKAGRVLVINADLEISHILEVNLAHANLEIVAARNGAEAISKMQKDKTDIIILDPALPDMESAEIFRRIAQLSQNERIPIIFISSEFPPAEGLIHPDDNPVHYITKPFDPKEVVALVRGYLMYKERMSSINQLTGLPNFLYMSREVERLIRKKAVFAALFITLHDLKGINRLYGYSQGDLIVRLLAEAVSGAVRTLGEVGDLAGYLGADRFIIITSQLKAKAICRKVIADFRRHAQPLLARMIPPEGAAGAVPEGNPLSCVHIAVVTNRGHTYHSFPEISRVAEEQIEHLRRLPQDNCSFDLEVTGIDATISSLHGVVVPQERAAPGAVQEILGWFDFLAAELEHPLQECLKLLRGAGELERVDSATVDALRTNMNRLARTIDSIAGLVRARYRDRAGFGEVVVADVLRWVVGQVRRQAKEKKIVIKLEVPRSVSRLVRDERDVARCLLYMMRFMVRVASPASSIRISLAEVDGSISISASCPQPEIPMDKLEDFLKEGRVAAYGWQGVSPGEMQLAKALARDIGGELSIMSGEEGGITCYLAIPQRWWRWAGEVDKLPLAMEISHREAKAALGRIRRALSSLCPSKAQQAVLERELEVLRGKTQELGVLGNRSLFLVDELRSRLEAQLERLSQQETEQLAALDAILICCRQIAQAHRARHIFELASARRVAEYALAIADALKVAGSERQVLRDAALLKDFGILLSAEDMVAQAVVPTVEEAVALRVHCEPVWRALSAIGFLAPALGLVRYCYQRYDDKSGRYGHSGDDIPLGARILAVANAFDVLVSGHSPYGQLPAKVAVQKIAAEAGRRYDPHVVNAFLLLWKQRGLKITIAPGLDEPLRF